MTPSVELDPDARQVIDSMTAEALNAPISGDLAARRALMRARTGWLAGRAPEVARVDDLRIPADHGFRVRLYGDSSHADLPLLIYLHGGGWMTGDLDTHDIICRELTVRSGHVVIAVDYPLAPEAPFPIAIEAIESVVIHLRDRGLDGWDRTRTVIGGDSAGGNLAAVIARRHPAWFDGQLLIYPVVDVPRDRTSYRAYGTGYTLGGQDMADFWDAYCPDLALRETPDAALLGAPVPSGLPGAFILIASHDVLADEGRAYAEALRSAGVQVEIVEAAGLPHGFLRMTGVIPAAKPYLDRCARYLRETASKVDDRPTLHDDKEPT